jgi:hypothetical protein
VKALSIRQPWAWLIVNGHKDIENREWRTNFRGRIYVHASKGMTQDEYAIGYVIAEENSVKLPAFKDLQRGGIVGAVTITGCVSKSDSPWFFGPYGFELSEPESLPFVPAKGSLGFFNIHIGGSEA